MKRVAIDKLWLACAATAAVLALAGAGLAGGGFASPLPPRGAGGPLVGVAAAPRC